MRDNGDNTSHSWHVPCYLVLGTWYFAPVMPALRKAGHEVHALPLSGLGGPSARASTMNLDTRIEDVVSYIEFEQFHDVVLCGHSYSGMVIAGVADRLPGRVKKLMFIDAMVPENGESVWSPGRRRSATCLSKMLQMDSLRLHLPGSINARGRTLSRRSCNP